ncbi:MAG: precorrin-6y C5,15-methyltransferase (decarboxylating) subunit CbiE [Faecousia sp.]
MSTCYLIGIGMGNSETLTLGAARRIAGCGLLIGAKRMLDAFPDHSGRKLALIRAEDIASAVRAFDGDSAVLLSGDPGFYSGAARLYDLLDGITVETIPGISSLNYFCARLHTAWQDACLVSVHGRAANAVGQIQSHEKTFLLTGGNCTAGDLCRLLTEAGLGHVKVHVGQRLSYPDERVVSGTAAELAKEHFDDLAVVLTENPAPTAWKAGAPCLWDDQLIRGKSPMTKENIRLFAVARLGITRESVVWDVGAGTGSVSAACAMAAWQGQVWAVEKELEALELIGQNKQALALSNLHIVPGEAPGALAKLPKPDCVFIGGSSGSMDGIFQVALEKNPAARICLTAVSLESLTDGLDCMKRFGLTKVDVTQISAAQAKTLGRYHMMMGQNPVWILSGEGQV